MSPQIYWAGDSPFIQCPRQKPGWESSFTPIFPPHLKIQYLLLHLISICVSPLAPCFCFSTGLPSFANIITSTFASVFLPPISFFLTLPSLLGWWLVFKFDYASPLIMTFNSFPMYPFVSSSVSFVYSSGPCLILLVRQLVVPWQEPVQPRLFCDAFPSHVMRALLLCIWHHWIWFSLLLLCSLHCLSGFQAPGVRFCVTELSRTSTESLLSLFFG